MRCHSQALFALHERITPVTALGGWRQAQQNADCGGGSRKVILSPTQAPCGVYCFLTLL